MNFPRQSVRFLYVVSTFSYSSYPIFFSISHFRRGTMEVIVVGYVYFFRSVDEITDDKFLSGNESA